MYDFGLIFRRELSDSSYKENPTASFGYLFSSLRDLRISFQL
jgi:hypothetical protein